MHSKSHRENVYHTKQTNQVSWFQGHAERSLQFIHSTGVAQDGHIMDVGGGTSALLDDLLREGYRNITALDISGAALQAAQVRLKADQRPGKDEARVHWLKAGITQVEFPEASVDVWHDRPETLHDEFGAAFKMANSADEIHHTTSGADQKFICCYCRR